MDSDLEFEIDLKDMLYRIFVQWRVILRGVIVIAIIMAGFRLAQGLQTQFNAEKLSKAENKYKIEYDDYLATGERLERQIANLQDDSVQQQIYNEKSALMKIDPLEKWVGSFVLYLNANYQIDPSLTFQNTDPTQRMLLAYNGYLSSGEFYTAVLEKTDIVDEIRFLTEILSRSINTDSSTITVTAVGKSSEDVSNLLNIVKELLYSKYETYQATLGDHTIEFLTESLYSTIDLNLDEQQKANTLKINEIANKIGELDLKQEEWSKKPEPKAKFGMLYVTKETIKSGILGGIVGLAVMFVWLALVYVFSSIIKIDSDMAVMSVPVLGDIFRKSPKRKETKFEHWIDQWIMNKSGLKRWVTQSVGGRSWDINENVQDQLVVSNVNAVLKENNLSKAVFVSTMNPETSQEIVKKLNSIDKNIPCVLAGNILREPDAAKNLFDDTKVILLSKRYETKIDDVLKTKSVLKASGKAIIGSVILEDAE